MKNYNKVFKFLYCFFLSFLFYFSDYSRASQEFKIVLKINEFNNYK